MSSRIKPHAVGSFFKTGKPPQKKHRLIDAAHLDFIRMLPCLACGGPGGVAHHLTLGRNRMGRRAGDDETVPITAKCHNDFPGSLHLTGERKFWSKLCIDAPAVAAFLYAHSGDRQICEDFIREVHRKAKTDIAAAR